MAYVFRRCQHFLYCHLRIYTDSLGLFQIKGRIPSLSMPVFPMILRHMCIFHGMSGRETPSMQGYPLGIQIYLYSFRIPDNCHFLPYTSIRDTVEMAFFQPSDGDMVITGNLHLLAVAETEGRRWKRPQVLLLFCLIYMPATLSGCL